MTPIDAGPERPGAQQTRRHATSGRATGGGRRRATGRRLAATAAASILAAVACTGADDRAVGDDGAAGPTEEVHSEWRYPGADWARVDPGDAGLDAGRLDELADRAEAAGSSCLVVTRDGAVVDERYWGPHPAGTPRQAFSVTKSVTSTLVGIAADEGALSLDDPVADHVPEWRGTPSEVVTIRDLLSNVSGRHWDLATDYAQMALGAEDKTAFAIGLGQDAAPGEVWAYNNSAIQVLSAVLEAATGEPVAEYAESRLFAPVGMADSSLSTDAAGGTLTFMGLQTTCLDLARFGYLAMRDGTWDGRQVVPADFVEAATGRSSTPLNAAYGLLWWLNRPGPVVSPLIATSGGGDTGTRAGPLVPDAPEDTFWALGFRNQIVAVVPSEGLVAVRLGAAPPADAPFTQAELTMGVLDALEAR
jgi:CubicO group peptidase (beta-lactamase class C family)